VCLTLSPTATLPLPSPPAAGSPHSPPPASPHAPRPHAPTPPLSTHIRPRRVMSTSTEVNPSGPTVDAPVKEICASAFALLSIFNIRFLFIPVLNELSWEHPIALPDAVLRSVHSKVSLCSLRVYGSHYTLAPLLLPLPLPVTPLLSRH
jgi:hypothetical protein